MAPREDIIQRIDCDVTAHASFRMLNGKDEIVDLRLYQAGYTDDRAFVPPTDIVFDLRFDRTRVGLKRLIERILPYLEDTDD